MLPKVEKITGIKNQNLNYFKLYSTKLFSLEVLMIMFGALLRLSSMREMSSLLWNWKLKIDIESEGISSKI